MSTNCAMRSAEWFGGNDKNGFIARHHARAMGRGVHNFDGRPVIGIGNSFSELTPCNSHLRMLAEAVKRGVLQSGGFPLEFPTMSLGEPYLRPTSMMYRNLAAMEIEEQIRANPIDAVVLLTGCDKTTPAALMGAASAGVPAVVLTGGPMLNGRFRGRCVGSGTDIWRMTEELRAGAITQAEFDEFEGALNRSAGHCMTMGTASTMACLAEALGMSLPGASGLPAVDSRRTVLAEDTGALAVTLAGSDRTPQRIMSRAAFENALRINAAIGGSTNAVLHLLAIAGRVGVDLRLDDFDRLGAELPLLVDLMPSGRFLMEEFAYAGGLPALVNDIREHLDSSAITVTGHSLVDNCRGVEVFDREVIRHRNNPVAPANTGTAVVRGNLAPNGAVIKQSAAEPHLLEHTGPALVFDSLDEYLAVAESPELDVTPNSVLVVRNTGPVGYPGMPEVGNLPLPKKLLDAGVRDMLRISDARMSGTAFGACVLHVAPEAAVGGPLAMIRTGDIIRLSVSSRSLDVMIDEDQLAARRASWQRKTHGPDRGWTRLYLDHVTQADSGVDLDFLVGATELTHSQRAF